MKIQQKLAAPILLLGIAIVSGLFVGWSIIESVRIGSPSYAKLILGKDLIADVLPPPMYLVESHLLSHELLETDDADQREKITAKLASLQNEFQLRIQFWKCHTLDSWQVEGPLKESAEQYFNVLRNDFIPAITKGDRERSKAILKEKLKSNYIAQRRAVDLLVEETLRINDQLEKKAGEAARSSVAWGFGLAAPFFGFVLIWSIWISRSIVMPIIQAKDVARTMATGDLRSRITVSSTDEVGMLSDATNSFANSLTTALGKVQSVSEDVNESSNGLKSIANRLFQESQDMGMMIATIASASEQLSCNIDSIASAAEEISQTITSIANSSSAMDSKVRSISSNADSMARNVADETRAIYTLSKSFASVLDEVKQAELVTTQTHDLTDQATTSIRALSRSGIEIGKITETIKMIALQTNLLALNATIEATSAGEAGRGFAVVASEIKQLAKQSANAAENIATMVETIQTEMTATVELIDLVSSHVGDMNRSASRVSEVVQQQTKAANEITQSLQDADHGVTDIAQAIAGVTTMIGSVTQNISESVRGTTDVSRNVHEAATASRAIASNIVDVQKSAKIATESAHQVSNSADALSQNSTDLNALMSRFQT